MFDLMRRDLARIRRDESGAAGASRHGLRIRASRCRRPTAPRPSVGYHRRTVAGAVEIDGLEISTAIHVETRCSLVAVTAYQNRAGSRRQRDRLRRREWLPGSSSAHPRRLGLEAWDEDFQSIYLTRRATVRAMVSDDGSRRCGAPAIGLARIRRPWREAPARQIHRADTERDRAHQVPNMPFSSR